jgi:hypothetical protein
MTDRDRAEQAFRDAFRNRADTFEAEELSAEPTPRRRRTWPAILAAAAVLVLVAGAVVWRSAGPHSGHVSPAGAAGLPDGWRWESHADVEVGVPDSWGYRAAPGSDWCARYDGHGRTRNSNAPVPRTPYVDLTNRFSATLDILCVPRMPVALMATHLTFVDPGEPNAEPSDSFAGWTTITRAVGSTHLQVTTDAAHEDLARRVLATAHVVPQDQLGCRVSSPIQAERPVRPEPAFDLNRLTGVDSIAVCQYQTHGLGQPGLMASRLLIGAAAAAELEALKSAPTGGGPDDPRDCIPGGWGDTAVVLRLRSGGSTHDLYGYYEWCTHNGFDDGTAVRALTVGDCASLWGGRVTLNSGSSASFARCEPARSQR